MPFKSLQENHIWCFIDLDTNPNPCYDLDNGVPESSKCHAGPGSGFTHQGNCIGTVTNMTAAAEKGGPGPVCISSTCCSSCIQEQNKIWCKPDNTCYDVDNVSLLSPCYAGPGRGYTNQGNCIGTVTKNAPESMGGNGPVCISSTCENVSV